MATISLMAGNLEVLERIAANTPLPYPVRDPETGQRVGTITRLKIVRRRLLADIEAPPEELAKLMASRPAKVGW